MKLRIVSQQKEVALLKRMLHDKEDDIEEQMTALKRQCDRKVHVRG